MTLPMRMPIALTKRPRRGIDASIGYLAYICYATLNKERCRSGRTGRSRKPLCLHGHPGFESLSLRHWVYGCRVQSKTLCCRNRVYPSGVNPVRRCDHFQPVRVHAGGQRISIDPRVFRVQSLRHFAPACRIERNLIRVQAGRVAPNIKLRKHRLSDNGKSSFRMRSVRKHGTSLCRGKAYAIRWTLKNGDF